MKCRAHCAGKAHGPTNRSNPAMQPLRQAHVRLEIPVAACGVLLSSSALNSRICFPNAHTGQKMSSKFEGTLEVR